mgnify:CR=1 FL=1
MKPLRRVRPLRKSQRAQLAAIADLARVDPLFAAEAARVWCDITGGRGVFVVDGKPVAPASPGELSKALQ